MERFRIAAGFEGQLVPFAAAGGGDRGAGRPGRYLFRAAASGDLLHPEGKLLALAVSNAKRAAALPDVPTTLEMASRISDFDFWIGAFVPKQTPRDVVNRMNEEMVKALEDATVRQKLANLGVEQMIMKPDDLDARVKKEALIAVELARAAKIPMQ